MDKAKAVIRVCLFIFIITHLVTPSVFSLAYAESTVDRRVKIGLTLFRSMLAADLDIMSKKDEADVFAILLVYNDDRRRAEKALATLSRSGKKETMTIKKIPVRFYIVSIDGLSKEPMGKIAGMFLTERVSSEGLNNFIQHGVNNHVIAYSPFDGDVEAGALGGLSVEAKVRPYINVRTMQSTGIRIKPFFMKVTKLYEKDE